MKILIGALSGANMGPRREGIRRSWMGEIKLRDDVDGVFLMGGASKVERRGDELHLPCPDDYANLPKKTWHFCRWALTQPDWTHVFKCDDDTFINLDRLVAYDIEGKDYIGRNLGGWASGGAGYFMSRKMVQFVAAQPEPPPGNEDQFAGDMAAKGRFHLHDDVAFVPWKSAGGLPAAENKAVTAHGINGDDYWQCQWTTVRPKNYRIVMPTCKRYIPIRDASVTLLGKYWPAHPEVSSFVGGASWTTALLEHLRSIRTDIFLLLLDDYGLCQTPKYDLLDKAVRRMEADRTIANIHLTWQPLWHEATDAGDGFIKFGKWDYSVNTQAGLWRREHLCGLLEKYPDVDAASFELMASQWQNANGQTQMLGVSIPCPANASGFVDETDKSGWVIGYNNLVRRGVVDPRHADFLAREGLNLCLS